MKPSGLKVKKMPKGAKIPNSGDVATKTTSQLIMEAFGEVKVKNSFYKYAAPLLNTATTSMKINWFHSQYFPSAKQEAILKTLQDYLKTQQ